MTKVVCAFFRSDPYAHHQQQRRYECEGIPYIIIRHKIVSFSGFQVVFV